jgi:hypothetical protein
MSNLYHRAALDHATRIVKIFTGKPQYQSIVRAAQVQMQLSLEAIALDDGEDF